MDRLDSCFGSAGPSSCRARTTFLMQVSLLSGCIHRHCQLLEYLLGQSVIGVGLQDRGVADLKGTPLLPDPWGQGGPDGRWSTRLGVEQGVHASSVEQPKLGDFLAGPKIRLCAPNEGTQGSVLVVELESTGVCCPTKDPVKLRPGSQIN